MTTKTKTTSNLKTQIAQIKPDAIKLRRAIHQNPELSGCEFETAKLIHDALRAWGINAQYHLHKTAVSAKISNGKGPLVILRADTDALPITEETRAPFASKNDGVMHACGHDMHTAALLGAAKILHDTRATRRGTVMCLFQPSEEKEPGGALELINAGVFKKSAAAVFGLHVSAEHKCGQIAVKEGDDYAGVFDFEVEIRGRGGHGATPEKTVDPIVCASSVIVQLQTLVSRETPAASPAVLTVGKFHAGTGRNIIPDAATFGGTVRTYNKPLMEKLMRRIRELTTSVAAAFGASAKISFRKSYPAGFNDVDLAKKFKATMGKYLGDKNVITRTDPTMYAEDFARYQELVPGLYVYLGVAPVSGKKCEELHTPRFLPDENSLDVGIAAHILFVDSILCS